MDRALAIQGLKRLLSQSERQASVSFPFLAAWLQELERRLDRRPKSREHSFNAFNG
ncbi:hypothetical protein ACFODZ_02445 [Marinicella sediminis]|uniref:Uncharacterized protein n=1 Tax=Marinicella sediminis TaxID=1792834 RepID=A0ABV7JCE0_9GAMM|nr:hypothetical protein [Marinicella sediminis]